MYTFDLHTQEHSFATTDKKKKLTMTKVNDSIQNTELVSL